MKHSVPTVRLRGMDRPAVAQHFLSLGPEDRRLRFGALLSDDGIRSYVDRMDFDNDGVFAVLSDDLSILALVHVAVLEDLAELGLSVLAPQRGQGAGQALFRRAVTFLRNRAVRAVVVHCLTENAAMMHIARNNGMRVVHSGGESDAHLALDPPDALTLSLEWYEEQRAQAVTAMRLNARFARRLFGMA